MKFSQILPRLTIETIHFQIIIVIRYGSRILLDRILKKCQSDEAASREIATRGGAFGSGEVDTRKGA